MSTIHTVLTQALRLPVEPSHIRERLPLPIQSNRLYDVEVNGRHLVAKEFLRVETEPLAPLREFQALQRLAPFDVAPQPVFFDPHVAPVVVYEYLAGVMWDRTRPQPPQLSQLAQVWSMFHQVDPAHLVEANSFSQAEVMLARIARAFAEYGQWVEQVFPAGRDAAALCLGLLDQLRTVGGELAAIPPLLSFCRLDARFANIIQRPDGRIGLVDWEDSGLGDAAFALVDMMVHVNQEDLLTADEWQEAFRPYLAEREKEDEGFRGRVHLNHALIPALWLAILLPYGIRKTQAGTVTRWHLNGISANLRLRRYLARALAWPDLNFSQQLNDLSSSLFFPV